jgi:hypothetical protein
VYQEEPAHVASSPAGRCSNLDIHAVIDAVQLSLIQQFTSRNKQHLTVIPPVMTTTQQSTGDQKGAIQLSYSTVPTKTMMPQQSTIQNL